MIMTYYIINDYFELLIEEHIYKEREREKNRNHFMQCVCVPIYVFHSANYYSY